MPLPTIPSGNVASATAGGYEVANSCRFNEPDSAYMSRTLGTATNTKKFTVSFWIKRCNPGNYEVPMECGSDSNNFGKLYFHDGGTFRFQATASGSTQCTLITNQVFRDVSAWYHIVLAVDTTQGTAGNRNKLYVNGTQVTSFSTQTNFGEDDASAGINGAVLHTIGRDGTGTTDYLDAYLAEFVFIDGSQLAATSFGEFDSDSPTIWKPKDVSGLTFGNNGFYLDFEDSGDLGDDESGNSLDFAETNLAATDQATDTPTNNFCTLNPLDKHASATLTEGNLDLSTTANGWFASSGTQGITLGSGPWYFEAKALSNSRLYFGFSRIGQGVRGTCLNDAAEGSSDFDYMWRITGTNNVYYGGADQSVTIGSSSTNDICACHIATDGEVKFYINDSLVVTYSTKLVAGYTYFPIISANAYGGGTERWQANFGNPPYANSSSNADPDGYGAFEYATKSGYALCTKNLGAYGG